MRWCCAWRDTRVRVRSHVGRTTGGLGVGKGAQSCFAGPTHKWLILHLLEEVTPASYTSIYTTHTHTLSRFLREASIKGVFDTLCEWMRTQNRLLFPERWVSILWPRKSHHEWFVGMTRIYILVSGVWANQKTHNPNYALTVANRVAISSHK